MSEMIERATEAAIEEFYAQSERTGAEATAFYYEAPRRATEIVVRGTFDVEAIIRAAIKAMREPTEDVLQQALEAVPECDYEDDALAWTLETYQAVIDAALAEEKQPA